MVHQMWMPYHWGGGGLVDGDVVNDLFGVVADPNVFIQESKVATCDIRPGRRPPGPLPTRSDYVAGYRQPGAGITAGDGRPDRHEPRRSHETTNSFFGPLDDLAGDAGLRRRTRRASGSSPTPRCASAARRARWRARSGTACPTTGFDLLGHVVRQHRRRWARTRGGTSRSSSSPRRQEPDTAAERWWISAAEPERPVMVRAGDAHGLPLADEPRTCASTARTRAAWTSARRARCSAPSSAQSSCSRTSATAAATASRAARTG